MDTSGDSEVSLKKTFLELGDGGKLDLKALSGEMFDVFGIGRDDFEDLYCGGRSLTKEEYELFGVCPASMVPAAIINDRVKELRDYFNGSSPPDNASLRIYDESREQNYENLDHVMGREKSKVPPELAHFVRLRPRRMMQALTTYLTWAPECETMIGAMAIRYNWTRARFCATMLAVYCNPKNDAINELLWMLSNGGAAMSSSRWTEVMSKVHSFVKVFRRTVTEPERLLTPDEAVHYIYLQNLACRDQYGTREYVLKEIQERQLVPEDYTTPRT